MDKVVVDLFKGNTNFGFFKNKKIHHPMVQAPKTLPKLVFGPF